MEENVIPVFFGEGATKNDINLIALIEKLQRHQISQMPEYKNGKPLFLEYFGEGVYNISKADGKPIIFCLPENTKEAVSNMFNVIALVFAAFKPCDFGDIFLCFLGWNNKEFQLIRVRNDEAGNLNWEILS